MVLENFGFCFWGRVPGWVGRNLCRLGWSPLVVLAEQKITLVRMMLFCLTSVELLNLSSLKNLSVVARSELCVLNFLPVNECFAWHTLLKFRFLLNKAFLLCISWHCVIAASYCFEMSLVSAGHALIQFFSAQLPNESTTK